MVDVRRQRAAAWEILDRIMKRASHVLSGLQFHPGQTLHVWMFADHDTGKFAWEELGLGLRLLKLPIKLHRPGQDCSKHTLAFGHSEAIRPVAPAGARRLLTSSQAYRLESNQGGVVICGGGSSGLLYGVYAMLEALGIRYLAPGEDGTIALPDSLAKPVSLPSTGQPRFEHRSVMFGGNFAGSKTLEECLTFLARCRVNKILMMDLARDTPQFRREASRRGIACEVGAHHFTDLLPREQFARHPEYFRLQRPGLTSPRSADHNCCPCSAGARRTLRRNAARMARKHAGAVGFHWWPDDIMGGGWCNCPACKHLSASEQSLLCSNTAAQAVHAIDPSMQVAFLGYHDTCDVPTAVVPEPNVFLLYAPRDRCYAHAFGDPKCQRNVQRSRRLQEFLKVFGGNGYTGPFDYYVDGILFRHFSPPLLNVMAGDMKHYQRIGIGQLTSHFGGTREIASVEVLNTIAFGRMGYDAGVKPGDVVRQYCQAFGRQARAMETLLNQWQDVLRPALSMCGYDVSSEGDYMFPVGAAGEAADSYARSLAKTHRQLKALAARAARTVAAGLPPRPKLCLNELKEVLALAAAELEIWKNQVLGQNVRMEYLRTGDTKHLKTAGRAFAAGAMSSRRAVARFAPPYRLERNGYRDIQKVMSDELEYLARWCADEGRRRARQ